METFKNAVYELNENEFNEVLEHWNQYIAECCVEGTPLLETREDYLEWAKDFDYDWESAQQDGVTAREFIMYWK